MKEIGNEELKMIIQYKNKLYIASKRTDFRIGDIYFDYRDGFYKEIETQKDANDMNYMAPELFCLLDEIV